MKNNYEEMDSLVGYLQQTFGASYFYLCIFAGPLTEETFKVQAYMSCAENFRTMLMSLL